MRKLIAVGVVIGGLLAGAGVASAQLGGQGGTGDPLQLAASGVVIPFVQGGPNGLKALVEVASPVGSNCSDPKNPSCDGGDIHLIFFTNDCKRQDSVPLPLTTNDIGFVDPDPSTKTSQNGIVLIGSLLPTNALEPLYNPIHSRVYEFNPVDGRSRVLEPIIIDAAEFGLDRRHTSKLWSPLRTAATFYAPFEGLDPASGKTLNTQLTFICPRDSVQGSSSAPFGKSSGTYAGPGSLTPFTSTGFPQIDPPFWHFDAITGPSSLAISGQIYDTDEFLYADVTFGCDCLSPDVPVNTLSSSGTAYSDPVNAVHGTYTEIFVAQPGAWTPGDGTGTHQLNPGSFVAYRDVFSAGSALNKFFGRVSNGSVGAIIFGNTDPSNDSR